ncbi:Putative integral membrane protein [Halogranum amylolyticum]|uniref:Putative integral membrane protein n=1 Tax=Halogranum amylolyticum TaxID=660520 RepID=A0A1H8R3C6_9EURY|nr:DUF2391 family protein [Halogranum amylolyticum]SEO60413.1 Putative integral membrane protein [Halogranum amylolyticum]
MVRVGRQRRFQLADTAQQIVGGFLLAGPFVVTDEVWGLAVGMEWYQAVLTVAIVFAVGYGALYKADDDRDPDREAEVGGVPVRFISLILVSYLSVLILALSFDAPATLIPNHMDPAEITLQMQVFVTLKAISIGSVFSVIGAATADTVF